MSLRHWAWWSGAMLALLSCGVQEHQPTDPPVAPIPVVTLESPRVDTVVSGLEIPWGLARLPDGRWLVSERTGKLRVLQSDGRLRPAPILTLDVHAVDSSWHPESGLMGVAVHPDFAANGYVFIAGTFARELAAPTPSRLQRLWRRVFTAAPTVDDLPFENRILRVTMQGDSVIDVRTIVRGLYTNHYHAGGALAVGPDGKLYSTLGDGRMPALAPQWTVPAGKVLRYEIDGSIPADNPDPTSAVWASGLRNTQALAWLPDGTLLGVDHGPSGLPDEASRSGRDELNVLEAGADYGWPRPSEGRELSRAPIRRWDDAVAPAGLAVERVSATGDSAWIMVGRLRGGVERILLERRDGQWRALSAEQVPLPTLRRVRTLVMDADGSMYITTSNRDIRGVARSSDDLIARVRIPQASGTPGTP